MAKLTPRQVQSEYLGTLSRPAIQLYGSGRELIEALLTAFETFNVGVEDIRNEGGSATNLLDQAVIVRFGQDSLFRFRLDRIQFTWYNPTPDQNLRVLEAISGIVKWIRSRVPGLSFKKHRLSLSCHADIEGSKAREFLLALPTPSIPGIGESKGNGTAFYWQLPTPGWEAQLVVDHSVLVSGGLFLEFVIDAAADEVDYSASFEESRRLLEIALSGLQLTL